MRVNGMLTLIVGSIIFHAYNVILVCILISPAIPNEPINFITLATVLSTLHHGLYTLAQ